MKKLYHYPRRDPHTRTTYCGADGPSDAVFANCHACFEAAARERESPNPVLALFQSMGAAYLDAEHRRAEAERVTRGEPGKAPPIVLDEDLAARSRKERS